MYKNFRLTEQEKKQILEQHKSHGYKSKVNEQFEDDFDNEDINMDDYKREPLRIPKNFESYYILVRNDYSNPSLLGGDSSETYQYSNLDWLEDNGYSQTEFHDIDEMFSEIEGVFKHFSGTPEIAKMTAKTFKKFYGDKPFVVWVKNKSGLNEMDGVRPGGGPYFKERTYKFKPYFRESNTTEIPDYWMINGEKIIVPTGGMEVSEFESQNEDFINYLNRLHDMEIEIVKMINPKYHRPIEKYLGMNKKQKYMDKSTEDDF
jgi:hypothetical protein